MMTMTMMIMTFGDGDVNDAHRTNTSSTIMFISIMTGLQEENKKCDTNRNEKSEQKCVVLFSSASSSFF